MVHFAESEEASAVATADSVTDALHGFLRAQSDEERLQYLRHTDESRSRILSAIQSTTWDFGAIEMIGDVMLVHDSGREIASVDVGFSNGLARTAVFELTADGPKLDWESFALHEQIGWEEFLDGTGEASFRIELTRDDYYNYNFGDQKLWTCFRLVNPKNSVACWGYTLSDGSDAHRLQ